MDNILSVGTARHAIGKLVSDMNRLGLMYGLKNVAAIANCSRQYASRLMKKHVEEGEIAVVRLKYKNTYECLFVPGDDAEKVSLWLIKNGRVVYGWRCGNDWRNF